MQLTVVTEHRFLQQHDGTLWTAGGLAYAFWTRYLAVFEQVTVAARTSLVNDTAAQWQRVDGDRVTFFPLPYYLGPAQFLQRFPAIRHANRRLLAQTDALILRVPGILGDGVFAQLRRGQPFGVEVVGDPYDVFAPGAIPHPLRALFRWWFVRQQRRQCAQAAAVAYVTATTLQRRYPPHPTAFTTHYSSIQLDAAAFVAAPREAVQFHHPARPTRLIFVGSLAQLYKAPDVLLHALQLCGQRGLHLHLTMLGDGKYRAELEALAATLGIADRVTFLGQIAEGDAVRAHLDAADIFVLPSRTEGLPRAMIEAMARALPCIGTSIGGIPELLDAEECVPPGDAPVLAQKLQEVITQPDRLAQMSRRNLTKAATYAEPHLQARRVEFYGAVKTRTASWLHAQGKSR